MVTNSQIIIASDNGDDHFQSFSWALPTHTTVFTLKDNERKIRKKQTKGGEREVNQI